MSIAIDLILALIMVSIVLTAVRRGFVVSVFKLLSAVAAVAVAVLFFLQIYVCFNILFKTDWDAGAITSCAADLANGEYASA